MPLKILITAGPTREMLDPVRYLSNLSTGEMGYALAAEAFRRKCKVTLVSGPTALKPPKGVHFIPIISAKELKQACEKQFKRHDILIMTAAVCDYQPEKALTRKIKRSGVLKMKFKQTPDILKGLAKNKGKKIILGFCLETENWIKRAIHKCREKNINGIVANYISRSHNPFGDRKVQTALAFDSGAVIYYPKLSKPQLAKKIVDWIFLQKSE